MFEIKLLARNAIIILFSFSGLVVGFDSYLAVAQTETPAPLSIPQSDPLLPPDDIDRELSPLERKRIKAEINALEIDANTQLELGKIEPAFILWFRQLRLYRAIGLGTEIAALGRVGEIAWQNNRGAALRVITQRLNDIYSEQKIADNLSSDLLQDLGTAYQKTRNIDRAIATYNDLLVMARQANNLPLEKTYLETLGELYLSKFNYLEAATVYEDLLLINEEQSDETATENYLLNLITVYNYTENLDKAIAKKEQLINYYQITENREQIGKLKISLADDYQTLQETDLAIKSYQEAIKISQSLQQIALTSEALQKLSNLYQQQDKYSLAITTYQRLLDIETQAYNSYGVMSSYESLGKLYLKLEDYDKALVAFSQGLEVAQSLDYQVDYFSDLIERVKEER